MMKPPAYITIRVDYDLKKAVEDAAEADSRTTTSLLVKLLRDYLRENNVVSDNPVKKKNLK